MYGFGFEFIMIINGIILFFKVKWDPLYDKMKCNNYYSKADSRTGQDVESRRQVGFSVECFTWDGWTNDHSFRGANSSYALSG